MSKRSVFCLGACVLAAVLLVLAVGSSSAEGRYFRIVDGELVEFKIWEPHTHHFVETKSRDSIELDPEAPPGEDGSLESIVEAVGGVDQLVFRDGEVLHLLVFNGWWIVQDDDGALDVLVGEGPSGTDVLIHHIDNPTGGYYYRVVDGALIALDPMTPHTGLFACMNKWSQSGSGAVYCVELDPNLPPSEQIEAIVAAVVASDNGPIAVEAATWRAVKALFLR